MSEPNLLANYTLTPATRASGAEYATYEEISAVDDIAETDVFVPWWKRWIHVRGLSLLDEAAIERAGRIGAAQYRKANPDDPAPPVSDWQAEFVEVLIRGVMVPRLTRDRAMQLLEKNARGIDEIVRLIRFLNRLNYDAIRGHAEARADARTPDPGTTE